VQNWISVSVSSTGQYQTAVVNTSGQIYTSSNYGSSWSPPRDSVRFWRAVSLSSSGQYQTAVVSGGLIYISSNFGETWSASANDSRSLSVVYGKDASGVGMWVATAGRRDRDVAASVANTMAYSYDGKLWRGITAAAGLSEQAWSVAYGKDGFGVGMWVAAGYDVACGLKWSYDGVTWNASTGASGAAVWVSAAAGRRALCVYWNGSMWLASTSDTRNGEPRGSSTSGVPGYLLYSYNGKNWLPVLSSINYASSSSVYSVLPNPVILDFGSFYDDQGQRGATIANTTAGRTVGAVMSGGVPIENVNTIVPYGRGSATMGQIPFLLGGDSGLIDTAAGVVGIAGVPITSELATTTSSLSTSVDGGMTWRAVPNSTRVMTKVNKILCDETTQQIVAVGTGNYSVATSTHARAADADGWVGVFGSRMTDTRTGLFERFGTGAAWFAGAKMWVASGRAQSRRGSSLAVSVNGTVWQDAKIVSQVAAGTAGMGRGGGLASRTTTSSNAYDNFIPGPTAQSTNNNWQYFEVNQNRTGAVLLSNWQNGNPVIATYGQWDNDKTSGNYPFIQKVTASGTLTSSIGAYPFTGPALIMHPDDSDANNIGLGYKNITTNTLNISIEINLSLLFPSSNNDGINYHIQRALVNSPRYILYTSGSILNGSTAIHRFNNTIELQSGEIVYLILNRRANYQYDHTRVDFNVNIISQVNTNTLVPYTAAATPLLTYTDSASAFSTQVGGIAVNTQYNRAVVGGSGVQFVAGGRGGLAVSDDGQTWVAGGASASTIFQTPTNVATYSTAAGSGGFDASFGTVALTQRLTTQATYPTGTFNGIVVNETGQYQTAAVRGGNIFISSDYGVNWTAVTAAGNRDWTRLSMSSSGQYQTVVVTINGNIWTSADYGVTWTSRASAANWNGVSVSSTGQYQTAVVDGGTLWTSSDYGVNWATRASTATWNHVSLSSTGQYQTAVVRAGFVSASSDYGVSWATRDSSRNWVAISISSTGQYQTALVGDGFIYTSFNFGTTWTARLTDAGRNWTWTGLSVSSTGQYQTAVVYNTSTLGYIYTSSDYGVNWTARMTDGHRQWGSISVSGSGQYQSAAVAGGTIYTSYDFGVTWVQRSTATRTNAFNRVRSSASGQYQIATSGPVGSGVGQLYVSSDYGQSWMPRRGLGSWLGGAVSGLGAVMTLTANIRNEIVTAPVFNNANDRITLGNKTAWNSILSNLTVECWFKTLDTGNQEKYSTLVSRWVSGDVTNSHFRLAVDNDINNKILFAVVTNTGQSVAVNTLLSYNDAKWYHVAGTYSSTTKTASIYVNGVLIASTTNSNAGSQLTNISIPLLIGTDAAYVPTIDREFRGAISDVRIWNVARSTSEIASNYQIKLIGNEPGLAGYWKLDQPNATGYPGIITTFLDSTANANHSENPTFTSWTENTLLSYSILLLRSTDYGATFSNVSGTTLTGSAYWQSVAMTNSGAVQTALVYGGAIYRSIDSGATWSNAGITIDGSANANTGTPRNWQDIAVAAETGAVQVTCVSGGYLYISTNTGATWVSSSVVIDSAGTQMTNRAWRAVAVSANGEFGLACVNSTTASGFLYRSVNSGATWVEVTSYNGGGGIGSQAWQDVGMSANGKYQVACVASGLIYYSKNYGASWTSLTAAGTRAWSSVSISENGGTISATTNDTGGGVWTYAMPDEQYYKSPALLNSGSTTTPATIRAVAYGNSGTGSAIDGYWVAGGDASGNTLAYSSNGVDWTAVAGSKTTLFNAVNGVAYGVDALGAPMWVAVGAPFVGSVPGTTAYSIAYSYNMTTWVGVRNAANFTGQGNHVAFGQDEFGAGLWVAVGQSDGVLAANLGSSSLYNSNGTAGGTIFYSYDGANWAAATGLGVFSTSGTDVTWGVDASGVATWVATGVGFTDPVTGVFTAGGQVAHSVDGRVWTPISITPVPFTGDAGAAALTVAYGRAGSQGTGAPLWIVGGSGGVNVFARSSRPSAVTAGTWTVTASNATAGAAPFPVCNSLGYSNGVWVAGNNTDATNILARSVDGGATWTAITASSMTGILAGAAATGTNAFCNYSLAVADFSNDTNLRSWFAVQGTKNFFFEGGVSAVATVTPDISAAVYGDGGGSSRAWWVAGGVGLTGVASLGYTTDPSGATGWTKAASADISNLASINAVAFSPFTQRWLAVGAGATGSTGTNILYSDASGVTWTSTTLATAATPVITLHTCIWNQLPTPTTVSNAGRWLVGGTRNDGGVNNVDVSNSASVYISTDVSGIATPWTPVAGTGAILSQVYSLAYNGRVWIAAGVRATDGGGGGSTSTLMRTTDPTGASGWVGITATNTIVDGFDTAARSITWNPADGGMWIATGENTATTGSSMIYSLDVSGSAGTWRSVREANSICFSGEGTGLAYTGDRWFAVGEGNRTIVATTGANAAVASAATWTPVSHGTSMTRATDIAYTGRRLIATGSGAGSTTGVILSTDNTGASWSAGPSTGFSDVLGGGTSIAFEASYDGVGRIIATGRSATNVMSVSADGGSTWSVPSTQFSSTNTVETTTQPLFTTGANNVAYVGNDTLFGIGGNDVHWTGKRWVAVGRNTADISGGSGAVTVTAVAAAAATTEIINNNTTPVATSDDGITWQCVRPSQAPNLSEGVFVATNSRIGSTPLIDSQILIADGGDTEPNTDYGGMVVGGGGGGGGIGTGSSGIDIIAELTPASHAAHSIGAVGIIGAAGNGGANSVGNASVASFDTTAFTITPRPLSRVN
jgi:hypothetical protein